MPTNNAIDVSSAGIVGFTGTAFVETTATNHAVLIGGATSSTFTNVGPTSTAGQVLQSAGASADPSFSTPTYPSASGSAGVILRSDGTNNVYSTATYPNTAGTSGNVLTSDGTNWSSSAPSPSYALMIVSSNSGTGGVPANGTTYYVGSNITIGIASGGWQFTTKAGQNTYFIPKSGTLNICYGSIFVTGTLATTENVTLAIRLNDTTNTNITTTIQFSSATNNFSNTSLGISVSAGDFINFLVITPTWATRPTNCILTATLFIS
jgi:hypothetical protein